MTPFSAIDDIRKALFYPFRMIFVAGLCFPSITSPVPDTGGFNGWRSAWASGCWWLGFGPCGGLALQH